ncbi:MAG: glycoside hydrolase family 2 [Clostridia bacterium]|nr:glycoside hydrolase family 2 [Clostridia bacterium]
MAAVPWQSYPRPQLQRDSFFCLNGRWDIRINGGEREDILVPFPPESLLSGRCRDTGRRPHLQYSRRFALPDGFVRGRVLLHFGAVDQTAQVKLNGVLLGEHRGGYAHFSFDITDCLQADNLLEVEVTDDLADGVLPYGKQSLRRGGMWYSPISGIWQTVWIESVPVEYVRALRITPVGEGVTVLVEGVCSGEITVLTPDGTMTVLLEALPDSVVPAARAVIRPAKPRYWSPDDPYLYRFTLKASEDSVDSYFALRTLSVEHVDGMPRLCLNGHPYFFHGLLDQGYFSDGIFTPASPEGYADDILAMKALGFNTLRKHIKVEPEQFYYDCDRLGMIVFQDMVNNGDYSFLRDTALPTVGIKRMPDRLLHSDRDTRAAFLSAMEETVEQLYNHPSVCYWTIFNEGWGQFDHAAACRRLRELDATRFIDSTSGWFKPPIGAGESDVESLHVYFKPVKIRHNRGGDRPVVLSEFGGYAYKPEGHAFNLDKIYGYRILPSSEALTDAVERLYLDEILPAIGRGLCAAIYTQVSDVEDETNGLLSYDRRVTKVDAARMCALAEQLKIK